MAKKLTQFWVIIVETFSCQKHGPYFSEQEVDSEARVIVNQIFKDSPKRGQNLRVMLMEMDPRGNFEMSLYTPQFLLDFLNEASRSNRK